MLIDLLPEVFTDGSRRYSSIVLLYQHLPDGEVIYVELLRETVITISDNITNPVAENRKKLFIIQSILDQQRSMTRIIAS